VTRNAAAYAVLIATLTACSEPGGQLSVPPWPLPIPAPTEVTVALDRVGCDDIALELVIPFYEGIQISSPRRALLELGVDQIELLYPAPLSIPAAAWRCQRGEWTVIGAALEDVPVVLRLTSKELRLSCLGPCRLHAWSSPGSVADLGAALARVHAMSPGKPPLAAGLTEARFYALRPDWQIQPLAAELASTPADVLALVHGWDPSGVDLGGRSLWSEHAEDNLRTALAANPKLSHLAWLNLRSFKYTIPRLGLSARLPDELVGARWQGANGENVIRKQAFEAVEMCLATRAWQDSRKQELRRLIGLGFRVIQLDEFPIAQRWHAEPCRAEGHDHAPADLAGEWRSVLRFVRELAEHAEALGVMLTSEEPSAVLLDLTRGYVDRLANREPDIYGFWTRSPGTRPVALFSSAFSALSSPYTDADPTGPVPRGWLTMRKHSPDTR
jgi:hypothetical protein